LAPALMLARRQLVACRSTASPCGPSRRTSARLGTRRAHRRPSGAGAKRRDDAVIVIDAAAVVDALTMPDRRRRPALRTGPGRSARSAPPRPRGRRSPARPEPRGEDQLKPSGRRPLGLRRSAHSAVAGGGRPASAGVLAPGKHVGL
jgi:hypothetical protein